MLTCINFCLFNQVIKKFRDEELEHHDIGLEHDAELVRTYLYCLLVVLWAPDVAVRGLGRFLFLENRFHGDCQRKENSTVL